MKELIKDMLKDLGLAIATVVLVGLVLTVTCFIDEFIMSWGYVLVLSTILYTSWRIGQPLVARREKEKRRRMK
ncbi:hypothetical protein QTL86_02505 [Cellulosilyticum sp. ST5]|uniref:hypothetical protein n=1 Tax=Cellulosilyticum sp. ST5 TaxID=3055805 RepID=UPI003977881D